MSPVGEDNEVCGCRDASLVMIGFQRRAKLWAASGNWEMVCSGARAVDRVGLSWERGNIGVLAADFVGLAL